jgi:hypothetical protein
VRLCLQLQIVFYLLTVLLHCQVAKELETQAYARAIWEYQQQRQCEIELLKFTGFLNINTTLAECNRLRLQATEMHDPAHPGAVLQEYL